MHADLTLSLPLVYGFLLVLARVAGIFTFIPIPGVRSGPDAARVVASLALTVALFPLWPSPPVTEPGLGILFVWMASEFAFGVTAGLAVSLLLEGFQMAAQIIGLQAGYSYAATIDPNSQSDSGVLLIFAQLLAGCLFFGLGLDRQVYRVLAHSLESVPPGSYLLTHSIVDAVIHLGAGVFTLGLRLAMPELALLALIDLCFAVMGRLQPQIQFLSFAFPVKMLAAVVLLGLSMASFPLVLENAAGTTLGVLWKIASRP